jgi:hypothetical protein
MRGQLARARARYTVYGIWYMVYGIWYTVYGIRYTVYGIRYTVYSYRGIGPPVTTVLIRISLLLKSDMVF